MARPLRIELAGGLYHVTSRGDREEDIYLNEDDRDRWLALFGQVCARFNWVCHAYCQMTNHYHLVVETIEGNLSKGMRQLNGVYTQQCNRTHGRRGHLFQGRYKGILVEKESYLLALARHVVLNPVRAAMVKRPEQWPWSSYRAMIGKTPVPPWLQTDWILGRFGRQRKRAIPHYIDFVRQGVGLPSIWEDLNQQIYLGDERFVKKMQKRIKHRDTLDEIPRAQRRPVAKPLAHYTARYHKAPKAGMARAFLTGEYTLKQIAQAFDVHYSTVSRAVKAAESDGKQ